MPFEKGPKINMKYQNKNQNYKNKILNPKIINFGNSKTILVTYSNYLYKTLQMNML